MVTLEIIRSLLDAAYKMSPTGREQQAFARMTWSPDMEKVAVALCEAMLRGLKYGVWPEIRPLTDGQTVFITVGDRKYRCTDDWMVEVTE